jgi:hypothetical protein
MNSIEEIYNNITTEQLTEVEEMAQLFLSPDTICIAMDWDNDILESFLLAIETRDNNDVLYRAYFKGRITSEIELRRSIKQAATNGSNPAQDTMLKFLNNSQL